MALNSAEVATFLQELNMQRYHHEFVKKMIVMSFTQGNLVEARDATTALFSQLTASDVLSRDDVQWGVTRLLAQLDDFKLDCPRCYELTTNLLSCMVADELLSSLFLRRCRLLRIGGITAVRVLDDIQRRTPEYSKRHLGTTEFKKELQTMILEYFHSGDEEEFGRCIREIAPLTEQQGGELVRKVMVFAMERSGTHCELALKLLVWLTRHEEIDTHVVCSGFKQMYALMPDLLLDVPDAHEMAQSFVVEAKKNALLEEDWWENTEQNDGLDPQPFDDSS